MQPVLTVPHPPLGGEGNAAQGRSSSFSIKCLSLSTLMVTPVVSYSGRSPIMRWALCHGHTDHPDVRGNERAVQTQETGALLKNKILVRPAGVANAFWRWLLRLSTSPPAADVNIWGCDSIGEALALNKAPLACFWRLPTPRPLLSWQPRGFEEQQQAPCGQQGRGAAPCLVVLQVLAPQPWLGRLWLL